MLFLGRGPASGRGHVPLFMSAGNPAKPPVGLGNSLHFGENQKADTLKPAIIYDRPVGKNVIFVEFYLYSHDGGSGRKNWG